MKEEVEELDNKPMDDPMMDDQTIVGVVLNSGAPGEMDKNKEDFDILREAGSLSFIVKALTLLGGGDPVPLLTNILTYHVVAGEFTKDAVVGLGSGAEITTLQGGTLQLNLDSNPPSLIDGDELIDDPGLVAFDVPASNGIIHVLDGVLLPISVTDILGQKNTDFVLGDDTDEFIFTGRGQDFIHGAGGHDVIRAGSGNDVALGGAGNDLIFGGRGKDILRGDEGHDKIYGGRGADVIDGGADDDILIGGRGKDIFVHDEGNGDDWIIDFRVGKDKIDLSGFEDITGFEDIEDDISGGFFRTEIEFDDGGGILLTGVRPGQLSEEDFIFV
ncbi:MAG: fasciclin domain-containing protein [Pseudomonadota bacterium]